MKLDRKRKQHLLKLAVHVGSLIPLALLIWDFNQGQLGSDPIREITLRTGKTAITLLVLSLAITPINIWLGWKQLHPLRKLFGLYAFLYVSLHLLVFVWLDYGLNLEFIREALFEKYYALVGFAAFLILLPLAATSTRWAMRKMGKNWTRMHRWVYLAGVLAVLHYFLLVKNAYTLPLLYGTILTVLLLSRVKPIKQAIIRWRRDRSKKSPRQVEPSSS
ncbi:MAG: protein-methionine-sulfoxide reductase heme-binding subunit MsrQ [Candidatus Promineifilaceae bacterium]|nr:protein-methionine-sulfoxide reductase heme-binding subunit MsrQ [Candidatus Promineifilaceae bacterium]